MANQKRRHYTREFKKEAVELATMHDYSLAEVAANLGINCNMLGRWRREHKAQQQNAFPGTGHQPPEVSELQHLQEENRRLKLEREILKKSGGVLRQRVRVRITLIRPGYSICL